MPAAAAMPLTDGQREVLERLGVSRTAPFREVQRAQALLLAADGVANAWIAEQVGVSVVTVREWRSRFIEEGLAKFGRVRAGGGESPRSLRRRSPRSCGAPRRRRRQARRTGRAVRWRRLRE